MMRALFSTCLFIALSGFPVLGIGNVLGFAAESDGSQAAAQAVNFQRQVRPILAGKCFTCHGPDDAAREADLRLDEFDDAVADRGGYQAILPGNHAQSEVWKRIVSEDADLRMPPAGPHEPLSDEEAATIASWIDQGGKYEKHWAFVPPVKPPVPQVEGASTPIDAFINRSLAEAGLVPSPPADRYSIVRRLYLDLIGIPPTPEEADAFVADQSSMAYANLVDALMARKEYAERWARPWLDLARYADTNGYEKDRPRTIWPYRDWVLKAIDNDMPFDEFTVRQLAGDMIPGATDDDRIATGFHRNTMLNEEGGIDPQEYRFHAMNDRVATTGTVWMGMTTGCAQCHTHKYDPITHTDYYAMFALLNGADETEWEVADETVIRRRAEILADIRRLEDEMIETWFTDPAPAAESPGVADSPEAATQRTEVRQALDAFIRANRDSARRWEIVVPSAMSTTLPKLTVQDDGSILGSGDVTKRDVYTLTFDPPADGKTYTAIRLEALPHDSLPASGPGMAFYEGRRGDFFLSELTIERDGNPVTMRDASASFGKISLGSGTADAGNVIDGEGSTGWSTGGAEGQANRWVANFEKPFRPDGPWTIEMIFERHYAAPLGRFRISLASDEDQPRPDTGAVKAVALPFDADTESRLARWAVAIDSALAGNSADDAVLQGDADLVDTLRRQFIYSSDVLKDARGPIEALRGQMPEPVRTLVMRERLAEDRRATQRYHRGEYLNPREGVVPGIPAAFAETSQVSPTNRYEFAQWLVSDSNPMFARVTVDRAWRELFGRGIVDTAGDYGTQSQPPSHPELLDYLATEFVDSGMSMKQLHRDLVMTDAYRRSSHARPDAKAIDPENVLLAIGPRRRLEGERIRDSILVASGLLAPRFGGPSVFPPQPASVSARAYGGTAWNESQGADRFRRSIYTYAKRTAPFAALGVFDGPTGETCLPRRDISNSPLQALTLLNDAMFMEMAQALADHATAKCGSGASGDVASEMFRRLVTRPPSDDELAAIVGFYDSLDAPEEARWMLVARALMNLDEVITTP